MPIAVSAQKENNGEHSRGDDCDCRNSRDNSTFGRAFSQFAQKLFGCFVVCVCLTDLIALHRGNNAKFALFNFDIRALPHKTVVHSVFALLRAGFKAFINRGICHIALQVFRQKNLGDLLRVFRTEFCALSIFGNIM